MNFSAPRTAYLSETYAAPRFDEAPRIQDVLVRIRAEYAEMPGLCLTRHQAQRLWGLDADACDAVLAALVDVGYLKLTTCGYVRA